MWEDDFYCYLFISKGELILPTLQRSVVHPLFDQGLTTAGLPQALLTEIICRWGRLVPAPKENMFTSQKENRLSEVSLADMTAKWLVH